MAAVEDAFFRCGVRFRLEIGGIPSFIPEMLKRMLRLKKITIIGKHRFADSLEGIVFGIKFRLS